MTENTWLDDQRAIEALMDLPLPVAVVQRSGVVELVNRRFSDELDPGVLTPELITRLARRDAPASVRLHRGNGNAEGVDALLLPLGRRLLLILEARDQEIAALEARIEEMERLSTTDRLTGAWNRLHLDRVVGSEMARATRHEQPLSMVLLDVDHFKRINDHFGHAVGDEVLKELVQRAWMALRMADILFRWGGEEFVILVPGASADGAATLAERLRVAVNREVFPTVGPVTASFGVAEYLPGESRDSWFDRADRAMYRAKTEGRDRVVVDPMRAAQASEVADGEPRPLVELVWRVEYASGHAEIDEEHRRLFELANRVLAESLVTKADRLRLADAVKRLVAEVERHFAHEEAILERLQFAGLFGHRKAHRALLRRARAMEQAIIAGQPVAPSALVGFLAEELVLRHLLTADRMFFDLVSAG